MKFKSLNPKFELDMITNGDFECIVGIDEVGRGSWAGPVAVGAYVFTLDCKQCRGINDSKLLSLGKRESAYKRLSQHRYFVKYGEIEEINQIGIGKTIERLVADLVREVNLMHSKSFFVIDGQFAKSFGKNTMKAIQADSTYYSVAAASIMAKVQRDRLMKELHHDYPVYGFNTNVGYPTKKHIKALNEHGPSEVHRKSFEPIGKLFSELRLGI